jgi:hypothetical protein
MLTPERPRLRTVRQARPATVEWNGRCIILSFWVPWWTVTEALTGE